MPTRSSAIKGMTLLEVILSLAILASLMMAVSLLLRNATEMKTGIAQVANVNHRLQLAMSKISTDLEHAFMVQKADLDRHTKSIFFIQKDGNSDRLSLVAFTHRPTVKNSKESDLTYIHYKVARGDDGQLPHLWRGEAVRVPESFREPPPAQVIAKGIKSLRVLPWDGERWMQEQWNSSRRGFRNTLPHMVRIEIEAYENLDEPELVDVPTVKIATIVFNHLATNFAQVKSITAPIKWY
ncbi:MAG: prepilin-type N-terminal cleavage/methylation domain-containing protein [Pseudomonadota bacterium]|nr:prepilin-type N-terminal cleavage/methylation domain-containing protein [Pseudomonadota bacterium]